MIGAIMGCFNYYASTLNRYIYIYRCYSSANAFTPLRIFSKTYLVNSIVAFGAAATAAVLAVVDFFFSTKFIQRRTVIAAEKKLLKKNKTFYHRS